MPHVIALALIGAGLYAGYRWFARATAELRSELGRESQELQRRTSSEATERDLGRLEYDPSAGVYKPADRP